MDPFASREDVKQEIRASIEIIRYIVSHPKELEREGAPPAIIKHLTCIDEYLDNL